MLETLPRARVALLPTPLHPLRNMAQSLGMRALWLKRDDLTGISFGGNKTRKLEYVVGDALAEGADTLVTVGGVQSNHCRQTAAFAAAKSLRCILLLAGEEPQRPTGNVLLDRLFGAELKFYPGEPPLALDRYLLGVVETLEDLGLHPYAIPAGAFMPLGVLAYAAAMQELVDQMQSVGVEFGRVVLAVGTGGTYAGLLLGAELLDLDIDIIGISVLRTADALTERIRDMLERVCSEYPEFATRVRRPITVTDSFLGPGYGVLDAPTRLAVRSFAATEGIVFDPVYTGRAAAGLVHMLSSGELDATVPTVFWHTGGQPALFAYDDLLE